MPDPTDNLPQFPDTEADDLDPEDVLRDNYVPSTDIPHTPEPDAGDYS